MSNQPTSFQLVQQFHNKFDPDPANHAKLLDVRLAFLREEFNEVAEASAALDADPGVATRAHLVKELLDVIYVAYGTLVLMGVDADAAFAEVHRSNMSKQPNPGGKVLKGPGYSPAQMEQFV